MKISRIKIKGYEIVKVGDISFYQLEDLHMILGEEQTNRDFVYVPEINLCRSKRIALGDITEALELPSGEFDFALPMEFTRNNLNAIGIWSYINSPVFGEFVSYETMMGSIIREIMLWQQQQN